MVEVMRGTWALMLGMMLLMVGNGLQGTLLGVRGNIEGFSTTAMSIVMSGCVFRGSWAVISRDLGHAFHGIVGSHFTIVGRLVDKVHRVSLERFGQGVS